MYKNNKQQLYILQALIKHYLIFWREIYSSWQTMSLLIASDGGKEVSQLTAGCSCVCN